MFKIGDILGITIMVFLFTLIPGSSPKSYCYATDISRGGLEFIKEQEGFRPKPYKCPGGTLTVGYGSTYIGERRVKPTDTLTKQQAEQVMLDHIHTNCSIINKKITVPLNSNQYDSLCSIVYRVGVARFINSGIPDAINTGDLNVALAKIDSFSYIRKNYRYIPLPGLVERAKKEKQLLASI